MFTTKFLRIYPEKPSKDLIIKVSRPRLLKHLTKRPEDKNLSKNFCNDPDFKGQKLKLTEKALISKSIIRSGPLFEYAPQVCGGRRAILA